MITYQIFGINSTVRENSAIIYSYMDITKIDLAKHLLDKKDKLESVFMFNNNSCRLVFQSFSDILGKYVDIVEIPINDKILKIFKEELEKINEEIKLL